MSNEEKILAILEKHGEILEKHGEILEKHGELLTQMQATQAQMQAAQAQMQAKQDQMQAKQDQMEESLHRVRAYLELDVEKRFDVINEGIDAILEKMVPEDRIEKLEDDVVVLKAAVKAQARDIAELKKAQ